jgi:hypothetical protein
MPADDLAAEGMLLQIIEMGGALDVGQRLRIYGLLPFEDLPAADCSFELPHEFLHVVLHKPIQVDQVTIYVVDDFRVCWYRSQEIQRGTAAEHLDVAFMRWKQGDEFVSQAAFASQPGNDRICLHVFFHSQMLDGMRIWGAWLSGGLRCRNVGI